MAQALESVAAASASENVMSTVYKCSANNSDCILYYKTPTESSLIVKREFKKLKTIHINLDKNEYKNADYWNNKKTLDVYYVKYIKSNDIYRKIFLVDPDGMIKGSFTIRGNKGTYEGFGTGNTMDMEISIDNLLHSNIRRRNQGIKENYRDYQGKGLSLLLIYFMIESIKEETNDAQKLFIDADGSEGFWGYLGMYNNPVYNNANGEGSGYEKVITLGELKAFVNKNKEKINKLLQYKPINSSRRSNRNNRNRSPTRPSNRNNSNTRNRKRYTTRSSTNTRRPGVRL